MTGADTVCPENHTGFRANPAIFFPFFLHGPLVLSILARFDQLELHLDASLIENDDVQIFSAAGRTVLAALAKLLGTVGLVITTYVILVGPFINIYLKPYKK